MAVILPHSLSYNSHGGWETAWRTVDDAPLAVMVSADTLSMTLVSAGDGRLVFMLIWTVLPSLVLTSGGVVAYPPIGEALSRPGPIAPVPACAEAWATGHIHPRGFFFDQ